MVLHATALELKTYEDLCALPADGQRHELIAGEIVVSPSPEWAHQVVVGALFVRMYEHARTHGLGQVIGAPLDVRFSSLNVVQPDILFIRQERIASLAGRPVEGAPDLVVEVLSPGSRGRDLLQKAALYADHGVPEYWVVDPDSRSITFNVLRDGLYVAREPEDGLLRSTVLTGFALDPAELFSS